MTKLNMPTLRMEPPIGIIITQGLEVIQANGGMLRFIRHFSGCLNNGGYWLHKSRMSPKADISQIYVVIQNRVWCRVFYGGYCKGDLDKRVYMLDGEERPFPYPHMILAGPVEKAPFKIEMRGFQGFRYVYKPLW